MKTQCLHQVLYRLLSDTFGTMSTSLDIHSRIVSKRLPSDYSSSTTEAVLTSFLGISWVLATMFLLQIFTLIVGLISLLKIKKARFIPFVSSLAVMSLMIYVFAQTSKWTSGIARYEPGICSYIPRFFYFFAPLY
jgi:predicted neutral ceramidase superfamily lipid hydrolase